MPTARQQSLLDTICADFLTEGFSKFTIDKASRAYHCSKSTLYALGATRDDIVRRAIVLYFRRITIRTDSAIQDSSDPTDALRRYFEAIAEVTAHASPTFWQEMVTDPVAQEIYTANTLAATQKLSTILQQGVDEGEFRSLDANLAATMIGACLQAIQQRQIPASTPTPAAYKELGKLVLSGVFKPYGRTQ